MIQRPMKPVWEVAENRSLQDMLLDSHEAVVQIQPQKIKLSLKPRTYFIITLSFVSPSLKEYLQITIKGMHAVVI